MIINHNLSAMNAQRQLNISGIQRTKSSEKLSSGYRINRSADDAAGLTISEKMRSQIRGLDQGSRNVQDGISLLQVADGALNEVHDMLHRMNELSIQAANDTNNIEDREAIQQEIDQLSLEIDRISETTEFNKRKLFIHQNNQLNRGSHFINSSNGQTNASGIQYRTEKRIVTRDTYTQKQLSFSLAGQPVASDAATYTINASKTDVKINGESIGWGSIKNSAGEEINTEEVSPGTYSFEYKGMLLSFTVSEQLDSKQAADAINGLKWDTKETVLGGSSFKVEIARSFEVGGGPTYTITGSSSGITIRNNSTYETFNHNWNEFVLLNDYSIPISEDNIVPGVYVINTDHDKMKVFLDVKEGNTANLQRIANYSTRSVTLSTTEHIDYYRVFDSADVDINITGMSANDVKRLKSQKAYIKADDEGIWLTIGDHDYPKVTWEDWVGEGTPETYKKVKFQDSGTGYSVEFKRSSESMLFETFKKALRRIELPFTITPTISEIIHDTSRYSDSANAEYADVLNTFSFTQPEGIDSVINIADGDINADFTTFSGLRNYPDATDYFVFQDTGLNSQGLPVICRSGFNDDVFGYVITNDSLTKLKQYFNNRTSSGFNENGIDLVFQSKGGSTFKVRLADSRADIASGRPYTYDEAIKALGAASRIGIDGSKAVYSAKFRDLTSSDFNRTQQVVTFYLNSYLTMKDELEKEVSLGSILNIPQYTKHEIMEEEEEVLIPIEPEENQEPVIPAHEHVKEEVQESYQELWIQCSSGIYDGMFISIGNMNSKILGVNKLNVLSHHDAEESMEAVANALEVVSRIRSHLGAQQNRLEHTFANVTNMEENAQAAESRIRDTDMAKEMVEQSKLNILGQMGTMILSQANQSHQSVLQLLQ